MPTYPRSAGNNIAIIDERSSDPATPWEGGVTAQITRSFGTFSERVWGVEPAVPQTTPATAERNALEVCKQTNPAWDCVRSIGEDDNLWDEEHYLQYDPSSMPPDFQFLDSPGGSPFFRGIVYIECGCDDTVTPSCAPAPPPPPPPPPFSLSINSSSAEEIVWGTTDTVTVDVTADASFSGTVTVRPRVSRTNIIFSPTSQPVVLTPSSTAQATFSFSPADRSSRLGCVAVTYTGSDSLDTVTVRDEFAVVAQDGFYTSTFNVQPGSFGLGTQTCSTPNLSPFAPSVVAEANASTGFLSRDGKGAENLTPYNSIGWTFGNTSCMLFFGAKGSVSISMIEWYTTGFVRPVSPQTIDRADIGGFFQLIYPSSHSTNKAETVWVAPDQSTFVVVTEPDTSGDRRAYSANSTTGQMDIGGIPIVRDPIQSIEKVGDLITITDINDEKTYRNAPGMSYSCD